MKFTSLFVLFSLAALCASAQTFSTNSLPNREQEAEAAFAHCVQCGIGNHMMPHASIGGKRIMDVGSGGSGTAVLSGPAYITLKTNAGEFLPKGSPMVISVEVLTGREGKHHLYGRKYKIDPMTGSFTFTGYLLLGYSQFTLNAGDEHTLNVGLDPSDSLGTKYYVEVLLTDGYPAYNVLQVVAGDAVVGQYFTDSRSLYHVDNVVTKDGMTTVNGSFPIGAVVYVNQGDFRSTGTFNLQVVSNDGRTLSFPANYADGSLQYPLAFDLWLLIPSISQSFTLPRAVFVAGAGQTPALPQAR